MRDINDFFEGESYPAVEFGHNLQVVPLVDAKRIAVDYANQSKWINAKEKVPEFDKFYLVNIRDASYGNEWIAKLGFANGKWASSNINHITFVTHWQELPPAPL